MRHWLGAGPRPRRRARQADLRRQPGLAGIRRKRSAAGVSTRRHRRWFARRGAAGGVSPAGDRQLCRRDARRPLDRRSVAVCGDQRRRHLATVGSIARLLAEAWLARSRTRFASCTSRRTKSLDRSRRRSEQPRSSPYRPSSPYAASKAAADHFVRSYHRTYRIADADRPSHEQFWTVSVSGKADSAHDRSTRLEGKPLPIYGDGQQSRDWLFGEDLCRAVTLVLEQGQPGESFNVASGVESTNQAIVVRRSASSWIELRPPSPDGRRTNQIDACCRSAGT